VKPAQRTRLLEHRRATESEEMQVARDYLMSRGHQSAEDCEPWELVLNHGLPLLASMPGTLARLGGGIIDRLRAEIFGTFAPEHLYAGEQAINRAKVRRLTLQDYAWAFAAHQEALGHLARWGLDPARARTHVCAAGPKGSEVDWLSIGFQIRRGRGAVSRWGLGVRIDIQPALGTTVSRSDDSRTPAGMQIFRAPPVYTDPAPDPQEPWLLPPAGYYRHKTKPALLRRQSLPSGARP
jgi:hypothetical protein